MTKPASTMLAQYRDFVNSIVISTSMAHMHQRIPFKLLQQDWILESILSYSNSVY